MSLIRVSRAEPAEWMLCANSTCLAVRVFSGLSKRSLDRMSKLLRGVRSSCDMLARNSDLYLEVRASCSAFSSTSCLASSTSRFLTSSRLAFSSSSWFVCCSSSCCSRSRSSDSLRVAAWRSRRSLVSRSSFCWLCSSWVRDWDCLSSASVRMPAAMVLSTMPMLSVS